MINLLEQLFELTRNLKDASLSGDWDSVLNIQRQREALCQTLENMEKPDSETQGDEIRRLIQAIQRLENEVMPLIKSQILVSLAAKDHLHCHLGGWAPLNTWRRR